MALLVMVGAAFVAGLGSVVEVAAPCREECPAGSPQGGCSVDFCCSCCIHFRFDPPASSQNVPENPLAWSVGVVEGRRIPLPEPREIAHVPKPARS